MHVRETGFFATFVMDTQECRCPINKLIVDTLI